jgi:hypothetical protein
MSEDAMLRHLFVGVIAAVSLCAVPAAAQVALIQSPPVPTPMQDREALMKALLAFVLEDYLGTGRSNHVNRSEIYAPRVTYYSRGRISRTAIMADKAAYYRRWPSRVYAYVPETLRIENAGDAGVTVVFRHSFVVANSAGRRSGIAVTRLGVTLDNGRFVIVRETGEVDRRGG